MMTSSSFAVSTGAPVRGSSSQARSMLSTVNMMAGSVCPARTLCPVISMTRVERKCLRWSGESTRAEGTAAAAVVGWGWGQASGAVISMRMVEGECLRPSGREHQGGGPGSCSSGGMGPGTQRRGGCDQGKHAHCTPSRPIAYRTAQQHGEPTVEGVVHEPGARAKLSIRRHLPRGHTVLHRQQPRLQGAAGRRAPAVSAQHVAHRGKQRRSGGASPGCLGCGQRPRQAGTRQG